MTVPLVAGQTFDGLVAKAVERFLQSAIVVDDLAFLPSTSGPTTLRTPPAAAETLAAIEELEEAATDRRDEEPTEPANTPLNAKLIVDAFAERGVVCGVLRPSQDEQDEVRRIAPGAIRRSDLVILDWHLNADDGEAAIELLEDVIREAGEAMRLVAIYTGDPNLPRIAAKLIDRLGATRIDDVSVEVGPVRIVAIGKADEDSTPVEGTASESELPDRLVKLFANLADGLVRSASLSALAALRGATYRLLAGLGHDIDVGYVGQRALVFPSSQAEDDLLGMLVSELRAIVEDDMDTRGGVDAEAVALWLRREADAGRGGAFPPEVLAAAVEANLFNTESLQALKASHPQLNDLRKPRKGATHHITADTSSATEADERFAMRMTLKLIYDRPERFLSLGTIVRANNGTYHLCVQPICDSLRIDGRKRYPFVPLTAVSSQFNYVVEDDGNTVRLCLSHTPSEIRHWTFRADQQVRAVVAKGDPPVFVTTSGAEFRWIAQLNEGHAQRAAQELGVQQSRIGLAESDWLRRMSE